VVFTSAGTGSSKPGTKPASANSIAAKARGIIDRPEWQAVNEETCCRTGL